MLVFDTFEHVLHSISETLALRETQHLKISETLQFYATVIIFNSK